MLRNFLGNLGSGVIRLAVTVGILAAVAIFIVRPALDTTKQISKEANESFEKSFKGFGNGAGLEDVNKTLQEVNKTVEREIKKSFHFAEKHGGPANPKKLVKCIQRADGDVHKIQRCTLKF
jgi:methionine aminopeptidase